MLIALVISVSALGSIFVWAGFREYAIYEDRQHKRRNWDKNIAKAFGAEYLDTPQGKHRLERNPAAHELCHTGIPCAHWDEEYRRVWAPYYIDQAHFLAKYRTEVVSDLYGYSPESSFPGLSTPDGSSTDLTAVSTSMPIWPTSEDRKSA